VNAVALVQAAGFLSRVVTGGRDVNRILGLVIVALALPAAASLVAFVRHRSGWRHGVGPVAFLAFVAVELVVDYLAPVEFRDPARPSILVPYLLLFFGAIVAMGFPMLRIDRRLWSVTAVSSTLLLVAMGVAMRAGVG
jgi:hypothetical protein